MGFFFPVSSSWDFRNGLGLMQVRSDTKKKLSTLRSSEAGVQAAQRSCWMLHPWKCSGPGWTWPWYSERCACPLQEGWTSWSLKASSNPARFCPPYFLLYHSFLGGFPYFYIFICYHFQKCGIWAKDEIINIFEGYAIHLAWTTQSKKFCCMKLSSLCLWKAWNNFVL